MRTGLPVRVLAGVLAAVALAPLAGDYAQGAPAQPEAYAGNVDFNPDSAVSLTVRGQGSEPPRGWIKARSVEFECEDGSALVADLPRVRLRFATRRRFVGDFVHLRRGVIDVAATVNGRVTRGGRAFGEVYGLRNPRDPEGPDEVPECSTGPVDLWHAVKQ
jgi:hypothetical protein